MKQKSFCDPTDGDMLTCSSVYPMWEESRSTMIFGSQSWYLMPWTPTQLDGVIPKMMGLGKPVTPGTLLKMAIFDIYVRFLGSRSNETHQVKKKNERLKGWGGKNSMGRFCSKRVLRKKMIDASPTLCFKRVISCQTETDI